MCPAMMSRCVVELPVSAFDIATDLEPVELLIPDERLTHPSMSDPPMPPIKDTYLPIVLPEPETKMNALPVLSADEPAYIVTYPPLLTNESPSIIVTVPSLLRIDDPDVKLNSPPSPSDDTPTLSQP